MKSERGRREGGACHHSCLVYNEEKPRRLLLRINSPDNRDTCRPVPSILCHSTPLPINHQATYVHRRGSTSSSFALGKKEKTPTHNHIHWPTKCRETYGQDTNTNQHCDVEYYGHVNWMKTGNIRADHAFNPIWFSETIMYETRFSAILFRRRGRECPFRREGLGTALRVSSRKDAGAAALPHFQATFGWRQIKH